MRYMLDTNTVSYLVKGQSRKIEAKLALVLPSDICISVATYAELTYGLKRLPAASKLHLAVAKFVRIITILPWDVAAANEYADIRHSLTARGQPIGEMDMMIAAHAIAIGVTLVTNNVRHFEKIRPPLRLENWI
jgi:tRNA(fMet)-specific endonuclease VapC